MTRRRLLPVVLLLVLGLGAAVVVLPALRGPESSARQGLAALGPHNDTSTPFNLVSIPALTTHRYDGRDLRLGDILTATPDWTRRAITYRSGDLLISGTLTVPRGSGRHPVVVLAHGYRDPSTYQTGGPSPANAYLADHGYTVLHPDYRNHGDSDLEQPGAVARPLGYPADVINAVLALQQARLPGVDSSRVGLVGGSMGGGVALNALVARPHLVAATVLHSPVSSRAADNFDRWVRGNEPLASQVVDTYGSPRSNPDFWRQASARTYLERVAVPVQIHHGTADPTCPFAWSRATAAALDEAGADVRLYAYPGEDHHIDRGWEAMMARTTRFLDRHV